MINKVYLIVVVAAGGLLILMSVFMDSGSGPDPWLQEWTEWAAKYVSLAVAAYSVVKVVDGFAVRLKGNIGPPQDPKS
jgi:hypothetical protein